MSEVDEEGGELPPSKSARKRQAHALQKLGERLVRMRPAEAATLPLSEGLREAVEEARRLRSRGALARQFQYIGRLMRHEDLDALEAALAAQSDAQNAHARLKR
ncbi:MAG: ribosome biogenesis factor YjgA [Steroidobacteraceae bacterium]